MRLTKIKLVGFKSFVDPTTLLVHNNLVGVVGPNGCGKSNIIDAVTWVMGESSAKHLRGESLTDVIFNGSNSRQPVGQASAELIFDNTDGKLGGQYASYNEISIKRQMNREGLSTYLLNGTRCRRRDIQAIFLGTGLGPRSYAIIEQGVISRLIEAKPEELRSFIEEAAGISKYRERRRETENRISHTRDNIDRLTDIREELTKQLNHLHRQAKAAERYQVLKQEQRQVNAEMLALRWRDLNEQYNVKEEKVRSHENRVEEGMAKLRHVEAEIEKQRDELTAANESFNKAQSSFYQIGGEISQLEQKIQHTQEKIRSLEEDLSKSNESAAAAKTQLEKDKAKFDTLSGQAGSLEPKLQGTRSESNKAYDALNQAEQAMQSWQTEWDACNEAFADFCRQIDVDTTRMQHLESAVEDISFRTQQLTDEQEGIDTAAMHGQQDDLSKQLEQQNSEFQHRRATLEQKQIETRKLRNDIHDINEKLAVKRSEQQKLDGKMSSLEALQQDAAGSDQEIVSEWVTSVGLSTAPKLVQQLTVEPEWTLALETVLGNHLQDICVEDIEQITQKLAALERGQVAIIAADNSAGDTDSTGRFVRLLDKVSSRLPLHKFLQGVYVADDLENALSIRGQLSDDESVVSKDGIWFGRHWIRVNRQDSEHTGVLSRELQIQTLQTNRKELVESIQRLESELEVARTSLEGAEQEVQNYQNQLDPEQEQLARLHSQYAEQKTRYEQAEKRTSQLQEELEELSIQSDTDMHEVEAIRLRLERTENDKEKLKSQRENLNTLRQQHRAALERARDEWQSTHEQSHEIALQLESIVSQRASIEQAIQRIDIQISNMLGRSQELEIALVSTKTPLLQLEQSLEIKLSERLQAESVLSMARDNVHSIDAALRQKDQERTAAEQQVQEFRDALEKVRLSAQETQVRLQTVLEQIQSAGHHVEEILANLDEAANYSSWEERLHSLERKIHRLGPINLAAIDEFEQLSERKNYLDNQNDDLSEALTTLENAMKKIDRETRTRFKETFDELNTNLQEMFPVLFGGGHAYLELTGDEMLDTGVTIMARPPGKRNSSIHLLSGGEKALTAVALVFAIFKLNPAPFCILDEVDAPLDDTNVGRFCELVKQMSADVQFIFITHNKITMEIAQQLLGVTMQEAGVSRLVSVDVDEAVEMAATA